MKHWSRFKLAEVLSIIFLFTMMHNADAAECFGPPYSVEQGRGIFDDLIPRDLMDNEYQDLKELFQSLDGEWVGKAEVAVCDDTEDGVIREIHNYSIKSEGTLDRSGEFVLESTLLSRKKRTRQHEILRLFLSTERLASKSNILGADIELISVSDDELTYVKKYRRKKSRSRGGGFKVHETETTIKKIDATSFMLEKLVYLQGELITISTWQLESR